jgi:hypothetical protein
MQSGFNKWAVKRELHVLVNDQLDAQFFFLICLFQSSTRFEQPHVHHQENQLCQYNVWYMSLCVGGCLVCRSFLLIIRRINCINTTSYMSLCVGGRLVCRSFLTCIPDSHLHRVTYTRRCVDTIDFPDDEHEVARNM